MKLFLTTLLILLSTPVFAARTCHQLIITGVSQAQAKAISERIHSFNESRIGIIMDEHNPSTSTMTITVDGGDLSAFLTKVRAEILTRLLKTADTDVSRDPRKCAVFSRKRF